MAAFKDATGREWHLNIVKRVADEVLEHRGIDLIDAEKFSENIMAIAAKGTGFLVDVLWTMVWRQAERLKVTDEEFGLAMHPQCVGPAFTALKESIIDFFRPLSPAKAEVLSRIQAKAEQVVDLMGQEMLDNLDERLANVVTGLVSESSFGSMPASPGLIQTA